MSGTLVLGIGNRLGGDDAAGAYVVEQINKGLKTGKASPNDITAIDTATAPESYTSVIRSERPELLVLVDASDMGLSPGSIRLIPPERITTASFSTHQMPLSAFLSYVSEFCEQVVLIGVQPGRTEAGTRVSAAVHQSTKKLAELILENRTTEIPPLE